MLFYCLTLVIFQLKVNFRLSVIAACTMMHISCVVVLVSFGILSTESEFGFLLLTQLTGKST